MVAAGRRGLQCPLGAILIDDVAHVAHIDHRGERLVCAVGRHRGAWRGDLGLCAVHLQQFAHMRDISHIHTIHSAMKLSIPRREARVSQGDSTGAKRYRPVSEYRNHPPSQGDSRGANFSRLLKR